MAAVTDIRFVGYGVPDLHVERAFYRDKWGLAEAGEQAGLVYFAVEGSSEPCAVRLRAADTRRIDVIELAAAARTDVDALHGHFDYGILLYPFDDDLVVGRRHLQTALASKLFAYVAAGLPVLVSPELGYMAELVREHGIGLVIPRDEIATLADRLAAVDHAALCAAVARAQPEFCIERHLQGVLSLIGRDP